MELSVVNRNTSYFMVKPQLSAARQKVFDCISGAGEKGITAKYVSFHLGLPINQVVGRITELRQSGRIKAVGSVVAVSGKPNTLYAASIAEVDPMAPVNLKKYKKIDHIIKEYNKLAAKGDLLHHEIIENLTKLI